jgi:hypothetical protein
MRPALFLLASLLALAGFAADSPSDAPAKKPGRQAKGANVFPETVAGVEAADLAKLKVALGATYMDETIVAARKRLATLNDRRKFAKGSNEQKDLKEDFDKAVDDLRNATLAAALKQDPSLTKETVMTVLNAIEEERRQAGQAAAQKAAQKMAEERKAAEDAKPKTEIAKDETLKGEAKPEGKKDKATANANQAKALLADVDGVSKEDMAKFRAAAAKVRQDPAVVAARAAISELKKRNEYASADEKKGMRNEFEAALGDLRKANVAAFTQHAPTLSKDTIESILDAIEARLKASAQKAAKK